MKHRKNSTRRQNIDPITLAVIRGGIQSICKEMGEVIERTSYSPIFTEGQDYSCAFFDGEGEEVGMHAFDPNHLACVRYAVEWSLIEIGIDNLHPGDVILCNDPYRGGNHVNDCTVYKPIFWKGRLVGIPAIRPHLIDLGGAAPGNVVGDATDIFQEGLRIPPVKLFKEGKLSDEILKFLLANVRDPRGIRGDIEAIIGGLNRAERRIIQFVDKYGADTWCNCFVKIKDSSEMFMRRTIQSLPEGCYEAEDWMDDDGISPEPLRIKVAVTIKGDRIIVDFDGSSKQADGPINATYSVTAGHSCIGVFQSIGLTGDVSVNEGSFRPIKVLAPPGTVVNCDYPKPCVAGNTETAPRIADVVIAAMGQATGRERTKAACGGTAYVQTIGGVHPETGSAWVQYQYGCGGQGARATKDGNGATFFWAQNNKIQSVEVIENTFPMIFEDFSLMTDSGGPGKFRGGIGCRFVWSLTAPEALLSSEADRNIFFPFGVYEGLPPPPLACGHASCCRVKRAGNSEFMHATELFGTVSPSKWAKKVLRKGDVVEVRVTGGGGFGPPLERDTQLVLRDIVEEYISSSAANIYGVVVDTRTRQVDEDRTSDLRNRIAKGDFHELR